MAASKDTFCPGELSIEAIQPVLHLHLKDAAAQLRMPHRKLSQAWRQFRRGPWPARKVQADLKHQEVKTSSPRNAKTQLPLRFWGFDLCPCRSLCSLVTDAWFVFGYQIQAAMLLLDAGHKEHPYTLP